MQPLSDPRPTPDLKICGITDPEQAQAIAQMGVQAIGVIGVPATPRFVEPAQRRALFSCWNISTPSCIAFGLWPIPTMPPSRKRSTVLGSPPWCSCTAASQTNAANT